MCFSNSWPCRGCDAGWAIQATWQFWWDSVVCARSDDWIYSKMIVFLCVPIVDIFNQNIWTSSIYMLSVIVKLTDLPGCCPPFTFSSRRTISVLSSRSGRSGPDGLRRYQRVSKIKDYHENQKKSIEKDQYISQPGSYNIYIYREREHNLYIPITVYHHL